MSTENCGAFASELVECARNGGVWSRSVPGDLDAHLEQCAACRERWEAEAQVSAALRRMRVKAESAEPSAARGRDLMALFDEQQALLRKPVVMAKPRQLALKPNWVWALAAAAMLLVSARVVIPLRPHTGTVRTAPAAVAPDAAVSSDDAQALTTDVFVAVPFTPPLAAGEMVRIVETNLDPQELAAYGFETDPGWNSAVPAEMVVGEDGSPRAIRITSSTQF